MQKESYTVKCPKQIIFGDPLYFEEFSGKRLNDLVVDFKPPRYFDAAGVVLTEQAILEYPELMERYMTIYMAPKQTLKTYMDGYIYKSQEIKEKPLGVDTARYFIQVDGKDEIIYTGGDGEWGNFEEISHIYEKKRIFDAAILSIVIPESENFEGMKRLLKYFFEEVTPIKNRKQDRER